jgi:hypothetical protein
LLKNSQEISENQEKPHILSVEAKEFVSQKHSQKFFVQSSHQNESVSSLPSLSPLNYQINLPYQTFQPVRWNRGGYRSDYRRGERSRHSQNFGRGRNRGIYSNFSNRRGGRSFRRAIVGERRDKTEKDEEVDVEDIGALFIEEDNPANLDIGELFMEKEQTPNSDKSE